MFNKIVVLELPPFFLASIRFLSAGLLIFIFLGISGRLKKITKNQFINSLIAGFLFLTLGNGAVVWGIQYIDSGFTALLVSTQPLVLIIMLYFLEKKPIYIKTIIGIVLGMLGVFLLVNQDSIGMSADKWKGIGGVVVALICWGYGSIFVAKADLPKGHFLMTGYQMVLGGVFLFLVSLFIGEPLDAVFTISNRAIYSMIYLIVFGSIVAFTSFNYLLQFVSPEKVATSTYINPIVAMILGWWVLDEQITSQSIFAGTLLLVGVYFINSSRTKRLRK